MAHAIILNLVGIFALALLLCILLPVSKFTDSQGAGLLARAGAFLFIGYWLFAVSIVGWIIYVIVHFVTKYW